MGMPRPVWTGTISFGMVSIPVRLSPAVRKQTVSFNQLDGETMSRIRYRKVSEQTGEEVPAEQIVRAAPVGGDRYVVLTDDEIASVQPARTKEIDLEGFVPAESIDPVMFDATYHVLPDTTAKPYKLLANAIATTGRIGIGRFVMRNKAYLAAIRSDGERLQLSTLVFPDELVDASTMEEYDVLDTVDVGKRELDMAESLVEAMSDDFEPSKYVDDYRVALQEMIEAKAAGDEISVPTETDEPAAVIDLAEALEQSLKNATSAKGRHPSARTASKRKPAKKAAARSTTASKRKSA